MKTSATETRIIAPVRVFPYALALCTSSPGRDCENHQGPNKPIRHGRARDAKILPDRRRVPLSLFFSLLIHQVAIESSCGDRLYLTYGGPTFGIIYGPKSFDAPKRTSSLSPSAPLSLSLFRLSSFTASLSHLCPPNRETSISTPFCRNTESREYTSRVEFVNGYIFRPFLTLLDSLKVNSWVVYEKEVYQISECPRWWKNMQMVLFHRSFYLTV